MMKRGEEPVIVSACLLGLCTRYDGKACKSEQLLSEDGDIWCLPVCPEQLGGLPTPRKPAEIDKGDGLDVIEGKARVLRCDGKDVTAQYLRGAEEVCHLVRLYDVRYAYLKEGSPSCGVSRLRRCGEDVDGCGVTTAMLEWEGVQIEGLG